MKTDTHDQGAPGSPAPNTAAHSAGSRHAPPRGVARLVAILIKGILPLVVLAAGAGGAMQLIATAPRAHQRPPERSARLVQVSTIERVSAPVTIDAMGTVIAAREVTIQPQVSGTVIEMSPLLEPGARVAEGETLLSIDPAEYEVAVAQAQANVARSEAQLQSAVWELDRLRELETSNAAYRKELDDANTAKAVAEADVAAAKAALENARIDLERTTISAPFNGIVIAKNVEVGAQVTMQSALLQLVGTDEYWVQASVAVDRLGWIDIPSGPGQTGSPVRVRRQQGASLSQWNGQVIRLLGDLESKGRMARLLISVPDPLRNEKGGVPLLLGSYVEVEIEGRLLDDVAVLDRSLVHDGDCVWVMNASDELEIRPDRGGLPRPGSRARPGGYRPW